MIYRSTVDVINFYFPSVTEDEIGISTCHFNSFGGIHDSFKLLSAINYFFDRLGDKHLPSFMPW